MSSILQSIKPSTAPVTERIRADQVVNSTGGYTFEVTPLEQVKRFLILGTETGSFYADARKLTYDNVDHLRSVIAAQPREVVDLIVEVSVRGLAPKQDPALFALALAAADEDAETRRYALSRLGEVARTATALFTFNEFRMNLRREVGRSVRRALSGFYLDSDVEKVAYQVVKYRNRANMTHRDLLRIAHPATTEPARRALFDWVTRGAVTADTPRIIHGYLAAQTATDVAKIVREYRLSWEMLPDAALSDVKVWDALLDVGVPLGALIRQLPRLTKLGVLGPLGSGRTDEVIAQLTDAGRLQKARIHPIKALIAHRTYACGRGISSAWTPVPTIVDALDEMFYQAFGNVEPSGKSHLVALDVSQSMTWSAAGSNLTAAEAGAAMAMVIAATEPKAHVFGFAHTFRELGITPKMRLADAVKAAQDRAFGSTDASLAVKYADHHGLDVDTFVVITDNEVNTGTHPTQALRSYRSRTGRAARLAVLATSVTNFSIADPRDTGQIDIVGFSADVPQLLTEFSRGF